ncbi:UNVERIFIED_CONTAM: hypothetical protein HDU68_004329, partial [Siphonaria sp. JEL0065]
VLNTMGNAQDLVNEIEDWVGIETCVKRWLELEIIPENKFLDSIHAVERNAKSIIVQQFCQDVTAIKPVFESNLKELVAYNETLDRMKTDIVTTFELNYEPAPTQTAGGTDLGSVHRQVVSGYNINPMFVNTVNLNINNDTNPISSSRLITPGHEPGHEPENNKRKEALMKLQRKVFELQMQVAQTMQTIDVGITKWKEVIMDARRLQFIKTLA